MKRKLLILIGAIALLALGPNASAQSFTRPYQLGTGTQSVPMKATTAATGSNWTAFGSQPCSTLTVINATGAVISVRAGGAGESVELKDGGGYTFSVKSNANEISVRRFDTSNSQVDVKAVADK
jgi:hypothetical protein